MSKPRIVLITGCDSGFGKALASRLLTDEPGRFVVIAACLTPEGCAAATALGKNCEALQLDVCDMESINCTVAAVRSICERHGDRGLDALVNNAGILALALVEHLQDVDFRKVMEVNFFGAVRMTTACLPLLRMGKTHEDFGRIVNMCSILSHVSLPFTVSYNCSKAALRSFSDGLRRELAMFNHPVAVSIIEPGCFKTNITDVNRLVPYLRKTWTGAHAEVQEAYGGHDGLLKVEASTKFADLVTNKTITPVIDAMYHAVASCKPQMDYVVGADAKTVWRLARLLPTRLADRLIYSMDERNPLIPCMLIGGAGIVLIRWCLARRAA